MIQIEVESMDLSRPLNGRGYLCELVYQPMFRAFAEIDSLHGAGRALAEVIDKQASDTRCNDTGAAE